MAKANDDMGYTAANFAAEKDAGTTLTVTVSVGGNADAETPTKWRASAELYHHEQDASREGVRDCLAARGTNHDDALVNLLELVEDQWTAEQARGTRKAIADIRDDMAEAE